MTPSVLVTRRLPASAVTKLESGCDVDLHTGPNGLSPGALQERVKGKAGLVCLMTDRIDRAVIDAGTDLRVIANVAVGYDNVDVRYARTRDVIVTNTPDVLTEATAEFTWGLILSITRRIAEGDRLVRAGRWKGWALDFMLGTERMASGWVWSARAGSDVPWPLVPGRLAWMSCLPGPAPTPRPGGRFHLTSCWSLLTSCRCMYR